jgi:hypothetical protein
MEVVDLKDLIMHHYCGPKNLKPSPTYTPFKDVNNENFVFMMPHDLVLVLVWTGKTQNVVVKNDQNEFQKRSLNKVKFKKKSFLFCCVDMGLEHQGNLSTK